MTKIAGDVIVITGGTSGIGKRIAERFAEQQANVVIAARRRERGERLANDLGVDFVETDVAVEDDVRSLIQFASRKFGKIDCLINSAARSAAIIPISDMDVADFDDVMAVNVRGVFLGIKHVAPIMIRQGAGSIINISSIGGMMGGFTAHSYNASKGAILQLTRSAAAELGEKSVRVNCISPGAIVTGILAKSEGVAASAADRITEVVEREFATLQPLPYAGMPDDVASAALYLASDAARFVNGHNLVLDGGMTSSVRHGWSEGVAGRAKLAAKIAALAQAE